MQIRELDDRERGQWLQLSRCENVGPRTFLDIISHFPSAADALDVLPDLAKRSMPGRKIRLCTKANAAREMDRVEKLGGRLIALCEPAYPFRLRHIASPPPLICVKGDLTIANGASIGIVGARNASAAGVRITREMAIELSRAGMTVISGLARGIDTAAHSASLESGTIAAVAGGIDVVYPPENADLQTKIGEHGAIISEMPPGVRPKARHFPRRNRLISGLSNGVLVIEAAERSGSLITARFAGEQGRDVFAVPGSPLDPRSAGSNRLIREGAELVSCARHILEALAPMIAHPDRLALTPIVGAVAENQPPPEVRMCLDVTENDRNRILALLGPTPMPLDTIIQESDIEPGTIHLVLLELDLAGRLQRHGLSSVSVI